VLVVLSYVSGGWCWVMISSASMRIVVVAGWEPRRCSFVGERMRRSRKDVLDEVRECVVMSFVR
jgi:hypothetical protein